MISNVGFTGTQRGMTDRQSAEVKQVLSEIFAASEVKPRFNHGDCIGADAQAAQIAKDIGFVVVCHPPVSTIKRAWVPYDEGKPALPYLDRNRVIVDSSDILLVAPRQPDEVQRSGTWSTKRYAERKNKEIRIIYP